MGSFAVTAWYMEVMVSALQLERSMHMGNGISMCYSRSIQALGVLHESGWDFCMEAQSLDMEVESIRERYPVLIIVEDQFMQTIQEEHALASLASNHQCPIHVALIIGNVSWRPAPPTPKSGQGTCSLRNPRIKTRHKLDRSFPDRLSCHRHRLGALPLPCG